jgi:SAM-dependent methyltransferase
MKDFNQAYGAEGAYHYTATGFRAWFLDDNYRSIAARIGTSKRILDLGCGEGCLSHYIPNAKLVGVDYSQAALSLNAEIFPGRYESLLKGDLRDIGRLGLEDESFDAVGCSLTLMYLTDDDLADCLRAAHRLLAPGGRFVVTYPTVGALRRPNPEAAELEPSELARRLEAAGFAVDEMTPICPMVDKAVVDAAGDPARAADAKSAYEKAKENMTLDRSYHFVVVATKGAGASDRE